MDNNLTQYTELALEHSHVIDLTKDGRIVIEVIIKEGEIEILTMSNTKGIIVIPLAVNHIKIKMGRYAESPC